MSKSASSVSFAPRRLGHANLYVGDLEKSIQFYNAICGLELVRREAEISAGFLTNGNTHHDLGLMQAQVQPGMWKDEKGTERVRYGRNQQIGLNHLGWEMDTEQELVAGWRRAKDLNARITKTLDHQISRSVYVEDPDGNQHEFYADILENWRTIFNLEQDDVVTKPWDPDGTEPRATPLWISNPEFRKVPDAQFHAQFITHTGLVAKDYGKMKDFFVDVGGLAVIAENDDKTECLLRGPAAQLDLILVAQRTGLKAGLNFVALVVATEEKLRSAEDRANKAGATVVSSVDREDRRSITLLDPDGLHVVLYTRSSDALGFEAGRELLQAK